MTIDIENKEVVYVEKLEKEIEEHKEWQIKDLKKHLTRDKKHRCFV